MRLLSWNVNGLRAITKKDFFNAVKKMKPDVLCLQETKAGDEQVAEALEPLKGFRVYSNSAEKKGYSGTAIITAREPLSIVPDIGIAEHDSEGRVLAAEYDDFILVNVYTPNSGAELKRLSYRGKWDSAFLKYLKALEKRKPVIACGDFNVAHRDIDLARPRENYNKSAGYMREEIDGMDSLLSSGFTDSFRNRHPETVKYSWWSYRAGARAKNIGWRIDYFIISSSLADNDYKAAVFDTVGGSDHCPVSLEINLK